MPEPLIPAAEPPHAERVRTLLACAGTGSLATLALDPAGYPFGSVVEFAVEPHGDPVLLISSLAEHTRNLDADPRASLLAAEPAEDRLAAGRATLVGRVETVGPDSVEAARGLYLDRHPSASRYAGFRDFSFRRLVVEAVRWVGGFGRMSWVDLAAYRTARPDPVAAAAEGILRHMNEDHADALVLLCRQAGAEGSGAEMAAVDRYGFEIRLAAESGARCVRLGFSRPLESLDEVRPEMVRMVRAARGVGEEARAGEPTDHRAG